MHKNPRHSSDSIRYERKRKNRIGKKVDLTAKKNGKYWTKPTDTGKHSRSKQFRLSPRLSQSFQTKKGIFWGVDLRNFNKKHAKRIRIHLQTGQINPPTARNTRFYRTEIRIQSQDHFHSLLRPENKVYIQRWNLFTVFSHIKKDLESAKCTTRVPSTPP